MLALNIKNRILQIIHAITSQESHDKVSHTSNIGGTKKLGSPDNYDHYTDQYWNNLELVQQYINKNATGNKDTIWQIDIQTRFKEYIPFKEVLVIGCGNGWVERQLCDLGIGQHFDAFDISEKYLETARNLCENRDICYFKADINNLDKLEENKYDAIFNVGVLHHTFRLSHTILRLSRALKPDGLMFNFDYVGTSRNQYSNNHLDILKNINSQLPKRLQSKHPLRPPIENFRVEPTEAIHSDLVKTTFYKYFDIVYERDLNGGIAYQILWNNIDEFKKNDDEARKTLEFLLNKDMEYTESGQVPILFWYGIGKPKPKEQIHQLSRLLEYFLGIKSKSSYVWNKHTIR